MFPRRAERDTALPLCGSGSFAESRSYFVLVRCHDCCVLEKLIQPDPVACAKLTGSSFTCSGRVPGRAGRRVQAGSGMPPGTLWEGGGSGKGGGEGGGPDALDGKREEWPIRVVLLSSPWRQGCCYSSAGIHKQDLKGFSNDKVEKRIVLQRDERSFSTFPHFN